jgi:type IV pilus assembly protein PilV
MRMTPSIRIRSTRARGFTLIEALVALLVLSIGLLGIASLQLSSLRWNHGASLRSQATLLAYDIVDRMRANQTAANAGEYDVAFAATGTAGTVSGDDKIRWKTVLAATLPGGDGSVARVITGTTTMYRIIIRWDDSRGVEAPLTFVLETQI